MKKLKMSVAIFATAAVTLLLGAACGKKTEKVEIFGVKNIDCSYTVEEYDLLEGVTSSTGEAVAVSGDVRFGVAGQYPISYTCGNTTLNAVVKIYGLPQVDAVEVSADYSKALNGDIENGIIVTDSFGVKLAADFLGFEEDIAYLRYDTSYTAKYVAKDKVGNEVEFSRKIITQAGNVAFEDVSVDLVESEYAYDLHGENFLGIYDANGKITGQTYYYIPLSSD